MNDYERVAAVIRHLGAHHAAQTGLKELAEVACLSPCHRVIRETGFIGAYRWGCLRKRTMSAWEQRFCIAMNLPLAAKASLETVSS